MNRLFHARTFATSRVSLFKTTSLLQLEKSGSDQTFKDLVMKSQVPVVVDFYAEWCGPCRMISPILSKIASRDDGFLLVKVNVDEAPKSASQYSISALPTVVGFKNGKEVARFIGMKDEKSIEKFITTIK